MIIMKQRLNSLQSIRFIAFVAIFLFHSNQWKNGQVTNNAAMCAVSFFIILSGFLEGYYANNKQKVSIMTTDIVSYYKKKLTRFFPLHIYVCLFAVMFCPLVQCIKDGNMIGIFKETIYLINHLLLISSWLPKGYFGYGGWFISTLFALFLLVIPVRKIIQNNTNRISKKIIFVLMAILFGCSCLYNFATQSGDTVYLQYIFPIARIPEFLIGFLGGGILFYYYLTTFK